MVENVNIPRMVRTCVCRARLFAQRVLHVAARAGGAEGVGIGLGIFLFFNAFLVSAACDSQSSGSVVGSALYVLTHPGFGGCVLRRHDELFVARARDGVWTLKVPMKDDEIETLQGEGGLVRVWLHPAGSGAGGGIWSPCLRVKRGLGFTVLDGTSTVRDRAAIGAAIVRDWPLISSSPLYSMSGAQLSSLDRASLTGVGAAYSTSIHWGWLLNDLLVVSAFAMLFLGHPHRRARWARNRAAVEPRAITHCPGCRYDLKGLTADEYGDRRCPECGLTSGEFAVKP